MRHIRNSVKALIVDDGCILVVIRARDGLYYSLPGGGQEPGETFSETLRRECEEEINAQICVGDLRYVLERVGSMSGQPELHQVNFIFECRLEDGRQPSMGSSADEDQVGVDWLSLPELPQTRFFSSLLARHLSEGTDDELPVYLGARTD